MLVDKFTHYSRRTYWGHARQNWREQYISMARHPRRNHWNSKVSVCEPKL